MLSPKYKITICIKTSFGVFEERSSKKILPKIMEWVKKNFDNRKYICRSI